MNANLIYVDVFDLILLAGIIVRSYFSSSWKLKSFFIARLLISMRLKEIRRKKNA